MTRLRWVWFPLLLWLLATLQIASAATPEQDIVAIESSAPSARPDTLPGLVTGQRIMDALQDAMNLLHGQIPAAVRPGVRDLIKELRQLMRGDGPDSPLPMSYQTGNELWLPVRAEQLQVRLDAPDLRLRPAPRETGGEVGNLPARAQRITWLPVLRTTRRLEMFLSLLNSGTADRFRSQRLLEETLQGVRSRVELQDRPLILAYYQVEAALSAAPQWNQAVRRRLRLSAEALDEQTRRSGLADQIQAEADRLTPDLLSLQQLALTLRKQIRAVAGSSSAISTNHD